MIITSRKQLRTYIRQPHFYPILCKLTRARAAATWTHGQPAVNKAHLSESELAALFLDDLHEAGGTYQITREHFDRIWSSVIRTGRLMKRHVFMLQVATTTLERAYRRANRD